MASYATITDATNYFAERIGDISAWTSATTDDKTKSLAHATRLIDRLNFVGTKASSSQTNEFPRDNDTAVPTAIVQACIEIALSLLQGNDPAELLEGTNVKQDVVGDVRVTYKDTPPPAFIVAGIPSMAAWHLLYPFVNDGRAISIRRV